MEEKKFDALMLASAQNTAMATVISTICHLIAKQLPSPDDFINDVIRATELLSIPDNEGGLDDIVTTQLFAKIGAIICIDPVDLH